jgi:hypothetical protein
VLRPPRASSGEAAAAASASVPAVAGDLPDGVTLASVHWRTIDGGRDPADFRAFLDLQPNSPFTPAARQRLAVLAREDPELLPQVRIDRTRSLPEARDGLRSLVTDCDIVASVPT